MSSVLIRGTAAISTLLEIGVINVQDWDRMNSQLRSLISPEPLDSIGSMPLPSIYKQQAQFANQSARSTKHAFVKVILCNSDRSAVKPDIKCTLNLPLAAQSDFILTECVRAILATRRQYEKQPALWQQQLAFLSQLEAANKKSELLLIYSTRPQKTEGNQRARRLVWQVVGDQSLSELFHELRAEGFGVVLPSHEITFETAGATSTGYKTGSDEREANRKRVAEERRIMNENYMKGLKALPGGNRSSIDIDIRKDSVAEAEANDKKTKEGTEEKQEVSEGYKEIGKQVEVTKEMPKARRSKRSRK